MTGITTLKQEYIMKCPFFILVPEHYNSDGSCKCHDRTHREEVMMKKWGYTDRDFYEAGIIKEVYHE